jgi:hypothetical protein
VHCCALVNTSEELLSNTLHHRNIRYPFGILMYLDLEQFQKNSEKSEKLRLVNKYLTLRRQILQRYSTEDICQLVELEITESSSAGRKRDRLTELDGIVNRVTKRAFDDVRKHPWPILCSDAELERLLARRKQTPNWLEEAESLGVSVYEYLDKGDTEQPSEERHRRQVMADWYCDYEEQTSGAKKSRGKQTASKLSGETLKCFKGLVDDQIDRSSWRMKELIDWLKVEGIGYRETANWIYVLNGCPKCGKTDQWKVGIKWNYDTDRFTAKCFNDNCWNKWKSGSIQPNRSNRLELFMAVALNPPITT